jgi:hypothetical protein
VHLPGATTGFRRPQRDAERILVHAHDALSDLEKSVEPLGVATLQLATG